MNTSNVSWRVTAPIVAVLFFGGGFVGIRIANLLAPHSEIAEFISFFAMPVSFVLGMIFWLGTASFLVLKNRIWRGNRHDGMPGKETGLGKPAIPPGSKAFLPASVIPCAIAGIVVGLISGESGFWEVLGTYIGVGIVYGVVCWKFGGSRLSAVPERMRCGRTLFGMSRYPSDPGIFSEGGHKHKKHC
jgi:hypothetical protein